MGREVFFTFVKKIQFMCQININDNVFELIGYIMRRYSPPHYSSPRRGHGGRGRSPPRRGRGGGGGRYGRSKDQDSGSLLVRNIPRDCRCLKLRPLFFLVNQVCAFKRNLLKFLLICLFIVVQRPEELRGMFERFGVVRDVYIPKDYHTG